ncbi:hypothetical protein S4A8_09290 [Salinisphaera sp. S4-8]|uniref:hypothetical protein n=1 Tax=Salinisphaera sp. S4-8 TaxID=633357 RepID=UPI00333E6374
MSNSIHGLARASVGLALMSAALVLPAFAAEQGTADDTTMPATEHQADSVRSLPKDAAGTRTGEQVPQAGGMPATKAQKEELKENDAMSHDKAMQADTQDGATDSDTSEGATDQ